MDHISPARRSWLMAQVASKNTSPEIRVRKAAHGLGLRFRLHRHDLPGKPDLVFAKHSTVVFVHGCFWHRHPGCVKASTPKSRTTFWCEKFDKNVERDRLTNNALRRLGWRVATIWECQTKSPKLLHRRLQRIFGGQIGR
ncbi:MAG: DNA mismatch endonuclease Vsr [Hyphomonadaceae bacterium]|nr:DNA mismatch endonuclease Vsr [Hyphomonadaceae bacterium]